MHNVRYFKGLNSESIGENQLVDFTEKYSEFITYFIRSILFLYTTFFVNSVPFFKQSFLVVPIGIDKKYKFFNISNRGSDMCIRLIQVLFPDTNASFLHQKNSISVLENNFSSIDIFIRLIWDISKQLFFGGYFVSVMTNWSVHIKICMSSSLVLEKIATYFFGVK